jgi:hypothetical protein
MADRSADSHTTLARSYQRLLLASEAAGSLIVASVVLRVRGDRDLTPLLGVAHVPSVHPAPRRDRDAERVGRAVSRVARLLPYHPTCLRQALATRWMLRRRGIACEAHLGVVTTEPFEAHAWITVGGTVVQGGPVGDATEIAVLR